MYDVTLKPPLVSHTIICGGLKHTFKRGVTATVSDELAEICRKAKDRRGNDLFMIEQQTNEDIAAILGVQLEFVAWPSASPSTPQ